MLKQGNHMAGMTDYYPLEWVLIFMARQLFLSHSEQLHVVDAQVVFAIEQASFKPQIS